MFDFLFSMISASRLSSVLFTRFLLILVRLIVDSIQQNVVTLYPVCLSCMMLMFNYRINVLGTIQVA